MKKDKELYYKDQDKFNNKPKMKKKEELQNESHYAISRKLSNMLKTDVFVRVGKYIKIFSYMFFLTGIGLVFNSCMGGYVASEPSYVDYARPQRQYDNQIWIDGDWGWNSQTHIYVQKAGYWDRPRQGQTYIKGSWQSTPRGKSWTKGHWQKDNQQRNNQQRNNQQRNDRYSNERNQ
jgi:hypothetical protein